ncbi:MAG TPA: class II aldolase/adducin family protein [Chloroflexota bacterium]|nr:class II aldolase/adducin family protein [Chloroflexota bacterium]
MPDSLDLLRQKVAISMRILGMEGLVKDITGHVSARIPGTNEMFIRCRGGNERGLMYTDVQQIRRLDFDGKGDGLGADFMAPLELPIHGENYKARPEVAAVVHAHPHAAVLCGILGLEFKPIFGAYDPGAMGIAAKGLPVYPRSVLINRQELGQDLVAAMGPRDCCLMKGHGITAVGPSVEAATLLALRLERLAEMILEIAHLGREAPSISQEDLEAFGYVDGRAPTRANIPRGEEWVWAHYVKLVEDSVGIPADF